MHKDALHFGGVEHRSLHNLNGALFHNATALVCSPHGWGPSFVRALSQHDYITPSLRGSTQTLLSSGLWDLMYGPALS